MSLYIITKQNVQDLQTAVFYAGEHNQEEAVAVFTSSDLARSYIQAAGWEDTDTVAELPPIGFLDWLSRAHRDGTRYLTINPNRSNQKQGVAQPVLLIKDQLEELAAILVKKVESPSPPPPMEIQEVDIFHCKRCGAMTRQAAGLKTPVCCDQEMQKPAVETVEKPVSGPVY